MMTVVTTVTLKDETRNQWDRAMHERVRAASDMDGWVAVQLLREVDERGGGQSSARGNHESTGPAGTTTRHSKRPARSWPGWKDGPPKTVWYDVVEEQG